MDILDIVKKYLKDNGYDGLGNDECGCSIDDLFPCDTQPVLCCEKILNVGRIKYGIPIISFY